MRGAKRPASTPCIVNEIDNLFKFKVLLRSDPELNPQPSGARTAFTGRSGWRQNHGGQNHAFGCTSEIGQRLVITAVMILSVHGFVFDGVRDARCRIERPGKFNPNARDVDTTLNPDISFIAVKP